MTSFKIIRAVEAKKIMDSTDCKILDVRTPEEFEEGHIESAILLPFDELNQQVENVLKNKDEMILVYCQSGVRSKVACEIMAQKGYTNLLDFGGIKRWPFDIVL